jgi:hypothetical protein
MCSDSAPHTVFCPNFPNEIVLENMATPHIKITSNTASSECYHDFVRMLVALNT